MVSCDVTGNVRLILDSGSTASLIRMLFSNYRVGIETVEIAEEGQVYALVPRAVNNA